MLAKLPVSIKPVTRPRRKNKNRNFSQLAYLKTRVLQLV